MYSKNQFAPLRPEVYVEKHFGIINILMHQIVDLRGNVQLRLQKLIDHQEWDGAIFAFAGLDRSEILEELAQKGLHYRIIDWMIAAPSQGILGIVAKEGFQMPNINNTTCEMYATVERQFLNVLEGGCTAPIGALVEKNQRTRVPLRGLFYPLMAER